MSDTNQNHEINEKQNNEYKLIINKLKIISDKITEILNYPNLNDFAKKLENNFNEIHRQCLQISESIKNINIKFSPQKNFEEEEYNIKIINNDDSQSCLYNNTSKSGLSNLFYSNSIEDSTNKEKSSEKNNTYKIINENNLKYNGEQEKIIKKFPDCLKLLISKVNSIIYELFESNRSDIPDIDENDINNKNSDKIINYFNKIFNYQISEDPTLNYDMNINEKLKNNIMNILEDNNLTIINGFYSDDDESNIKKDELFNFNNIKDKLYYFINIISNKSDNISNKDLEKITKIISKRISLHNNNIIVLNNFPIDNFIKAERFEKLSLEQINKYSFFSKFSEIKMLKNKLLIEKYKINKDNFDNKGNFLIPNLRKRGKELYDPPYGWIGIGLNVLGKYEKNNNWLEDISNESEWAIAYRSIGANKSNNSDEKIKNLKSFIEKRFEKLKNNVYVTPNIKTAEKYATTIICNNSKYKILLMTKIKINKIKNIELLKEDNQEFWSLDNDNVRIYRVLFKKIN